MRWLASRLWCLFLVYTGAQRWGWWKVVHSFPNSSNTDPVKIRKVRVPYFNIWKGTIQESGEKTYVEHCFPFCRNAFEVLLSVEFLQRPPWEPVSKAGWFFCQQKEVLSGRLQQRVLGANFRMRQSKCSAFQRWAIGGGRNLVKEWLQKSRHSGSWL